MGGERHPDGARTIPATVGDLATYDHAQRQLAEFSAPVLLDRESGNERLFVAAFDGTGNSLSGDAPENHTNVARVHRQIQELKADGIQDIASGYVEGVGTQGGLAGGWDAVRGSTYEARLEEMYLQFVEQAKVWIDENPEADIRLAAIGFSRGAEQAAGFTRMVEERGIQDPRDAVVTRGRDGLIDRIEFTRPPLREPGAVIQAAGLFDPVGTGEPRDHDRRPAASVVSGFQITAADERRNLFQGTRITDSGITEEGRFLNVTVAGAHSNIGGGYRLDGLSIRSGNLMVDYLNALSSEPFLEKREVSPDPERDVIHRSEDHQVIYRTSIFDRQGERAHQETLAPEALCRIDCRDAMPRNEVMADALEWRRVEIGPVPGARGSMQPLARDDVPGTGNAGFVDRLLEQARQGNGATLEALTRERLEGGDGQQWLQRGEQQLRAIERAFAVPGQEHAAPQVELQR